MQYQVALKPRDFTMSSDEILPYTKAAPFRPFRIQMVSGRTFDIRHPEMVRLGKRDMIIFQPRKNQPEIYDDWVTIGLLLVECISHIETPAMGRNGE
jgi:hypothetical protein